jgi:hypothetical protein
MQRRDFLASAIGASAITTMPAAARAQANDDDNRALYEWRIYRVASPEKQAIVSNYLETAAVPAWGRMGLGPVGVFREIGASAAPALRVLLTYPSLASFAAAREALEADPDYQKNAVDYLAAAADDPSIERIDSWLMLPFAGAPQLTPPTKKPKVYELRTYESFNEERARKKIEMFDKYEIAIFPDCGFENVFFGETIVGANLPSLKYMLAAPDMAANEAGWKRFIEHPDWLKVRDLPEYKDTVSKITKVYFEPLPFSQL